jgi:hypothetical protein
VESFSALVPAEFTRLRELRIALAAWLERRAVERRAREAAVLATHEAAASAIRNQWQSIRVSATLADGALAIEVHATHRAHRSNRDQGVRAEPESIEPYRLIDALNDQVNVHSDANGTTLRMVQKLPAATSIVPTIATAIRSSSSRSRPQHPSTSR